jgi:hypothetical protein
VLHEIEVDEEVCRYVQRRGRDFRLCTTCYGPLLVPVDFAPVKPSDLRVEVGDYCIFVSAVQAHYINRITRYMIPYQEQCYCD